MTAVTAFKGGVYPLSAAKAAEDGGTADGKVNISGAGKKCVTITPL
jgi:hypothetical protein